MFETLARKNIRSLVPYAPGKPIEELERELGIRGAIKMASNENPLGPSPKAAAALQKAAAEAHLYPDGGSFRLKEALAAHLAVSSDRLIVGNGSNELLVLLAEIFLGSTAEAIYAAGSFVVYATAVQLAAARPIVVPMKAETHDLEGMAAAITPHTRLVFIANPSNPQGTIVRRDETESFLASVPRETIVVFDEADHEYAEDPDYPQTLALQKQYPNLVVLRTFSKIYGLAALRLGYGVADPQIAGLFDRVRQPFNVNRLAQTAGVAAIQDADHVRRGVEVNRKGIAFLSRELDRLGLSYLPTHANFLLIRTGCDGTMIYQSLLRRGVIVRPMAGYGYPDRIRVTVGTPEMNQRFIQALEEGFNENA